VDSLEQLFNQEKKRIDSLYSSSYTIEKVGDMECYISGRINEVNNLYENAEQLNRRALNEFTGKNKNFYCIDPMR
jgi:hypothetical protein